MDMEWVPAAMLWALEREIKFFESGILCWIVSLYNCIPVDWIRLWKNDILPPANSASDVVNVSTALSNLAQPYQN